MVLLSKHRLKVLPPVFFSCLDSMMSPFVCCTASPTPHPTIPKPCVLWLQNQSRPANASLPSAFFIQTPCFFAFVPWSVFSTAQPGDAISDSRLAFLHSHLSQGFSPNYQNLPPSWPRSNCPPCPFICLQGSFVENPVGLHSPLSRLCLNVVSG